MEDKELSPSDSIALIANVIMEAKSRFRDSGFSFIFMGACVAIASLGQFILIKMGYFSICYYPYFIMPFAAFITFFYYSKKIKVSKSKNVIGATLSLYGLIMGLNTMVIGFLFWDKFGVALFPVMFIFCALWALLTGVLIKYKVFIVSGILVNIIAYITFFVKIDYHPLLLSITSILAFVVPGFMLKLSRKENHV